MSFKLEDLSELQQKVLTTLHESKSGMSTEELAKKLQLPARQASGLQSGTLRALERRGLVKLADGTSLWILTEDGSALLESVPAEEAPKEDHAAAPPPPPPFSTAGPFASQMFGPRPDPGAAFAQGIKALSEGLIQMLTQLAALNGPVQFKGTFTVSFDGTVGPAEKKADSE